MNRRLTGILAWCALGLIVAIPGTDVLMKSGDSASIDVAQVAEIDPSDMLGPNLLDTSLTPEQIAAFEEIGAASFFQPPLSAADQSVVETADATDAPMSDTLPPIVPLGVAKSTEIQSVSVAKTEAVPLAPVAIAEVEAAIASDADLILDLAEENLEVAAIEPMAPLVEPKQAPVPMPANLRPIRVNTPVIERESAAPLELQFEDDLRSRVNIIETARQPVVVVDEPVNEPFWGDNPRYNDGRRLDTFTSEEIARADDASDSQFYEIWADNNRPAGFQRRGSFSEQLPARRGSSVRLDLLQNN